MDKESTQKKWRVKRLIQCRNRKIDIKKAGERKREKNMQERKSEIRCERQFRRKKEREKRTMKRKIK